MRVFIIFLVNASSPLTNIKCLKSHNNLLKSGIVVSLCRLDCHTCNKSKGTFRSYLISKPSNHLKYPRHRPTINGFPLTMPASTAG